MELSWRLDMTQEEAQAWLMAPIPGWTLSEENQAIDLFMAQTGGDEPAWCRLRPWQRAAWRREVRDDR